MTSGLLPSIDSGRLPFEFLRDRCGCSVVCSAWRSGFVLFLSSEAALAQPGAPPPGAGAGLRLAARTIATLDADLLWKKPMKLSVTSGLKACRPLCRKSLLAKSQFTAGAPSLATPDS